MHHQALWNNFEICMISADITLILEFTLENSAVKCVNSEVRPKFVFVLSIASTIMDLLLSKVADKSHYGISI